MMDFIAGNIGNIIVGEVLLIIIASVIFKLRRDKKSGKSSCGCGCSSCPNSSMCHKE